MPRTSVFKRKTKETNIEIRLNIDGKGKAKISTPVLFLNHLLDNFAKHGLFDLVVKAQGEDGHHLFEDVGICLGEAFKMALGDKRGINRAGYFIFPLDESLAVVAIDISGRAFLGFNAQLKDRNLIKEFFWGLIRHLEATLHVRVLCGEDNHHKSESIFKAFGKAMKTACSKDKRILRELPSTKGLI